MPRFARIGVVPELLAEKLIDHFCACLRALAERDGRPRSDHAGSLLPLAEMLKVRYRTSGRREGFARTDVRLLVRSASRRLAARPEQRRARMSFAVRTTLLGPCPAAQPNQP